MHEKETLQPSGREIDIEKVHAILARFDSGQAAVRSDVWEDMYDERGLPR